MSDESVRELERQSRLFGENSLSALEHAKLAAATSRGTPVTLRPYQAGAVEAFLGAIARGKKRLIVNLPTGTGKTVFGFALAKRMGGRVCWLAHRDELLRQPLGTAARVWPEAARGLVKAQVDERDRHVVVASVQTVCKPNRLEALKLAGRFGLVVVDECFPAGTPIGELAIEAIRVGDVVQSFDEDQHALVDRRVTRTFRSKCRGLVRLVHESGELVCTPGHPTFTADGWRPAGSLNVGDLVLRSNDGKDLDGQCGVRGVRSGNRARLDRDGSLEFMATQRSGLLLGSLQDRVAVEAVLGGNVADESRTRFGSNESQESHASVRDARESLGISEVDRVEASDQGRKRSRAHEGSGEALGCFGLAIGSRDSDGHAPWVGLPHELQDRRVRVRSENRDRDRRGVALLSCQASAGSEEGGALAWSRVDRVEVLERGRDGTFGGLCPDGHVYNLEVEGTHTYVASGVVVHNCHHVASEQYRSVLDGLGCFLADGPPLLGLTATLERADGVGLGAVFEEIVYQLSLVEAIDRGYLAPYRGVQVELPLKPEVLELVREMLGRKAKRPTSYEDHEDLTAEGDDEIDQNKAERAMLKAGVAEATAKAVVEHASDRKVVVFTCTINQAQLTTEELKKLGVRAEWISGELPQREREGILARFKAGETRVLSNASVLTEGWDEPSADCIVIAKPTRSRSLYVQMVGRGLRLFPGKRDCLVVDVVMASVLGLQTAATLGNTEPTTLFTGGGGGSREKDPETSEHEEEKRVLAVAAATLGEGVAADARRERQEGPRWLTVNATCWALSLWPHGTLVVDRLPLSDNPKGDLFEAFLMPRDRSQSVRVSDPGPFEWVFGMAEDYLRNQEHMLGGSSPRWRRAPTSQAQLGELARRGLPLARTAGDAADLLTVSTVRARLGY